MQQQLTVTVERYGMTLFIRQEKLDDYVKAHDDLWPEVRKALHDVGVRNLSIWKAPDQDRLFMYMEYIRGQEESFAHAMARYNQAPRVQEWEEYMRTMQVQIPGTDPTKWWQDCKPLFHMA